jgi:putative aldouronate transport system permease protein
MAYYYRKTTGEKVFDGFNYFFLLCVVVVMIYPFWQMIALSLSSRMESTTLSFRLFPRRPTLEAYATVFEANFIGRAYLNTIYRTVVGTVLSTVLCYSVGYALSKKTLPLRNTITLFLVFTMFFGGGLIPSYLLVRSLGLIDKRLVLVIPGLYSAWYILLIRNYIMSIPASMEESAYIDGANPVQIMFLIMIPLSMPIVATVALWLAVGHWNAWFDALIYIRDNKKQVLQMILRQITIMEELKKTVPELETALQMTGVNITSETVKAATIIVTIGPIILFYPFVQKYFIKGIMIGALKG